MVLAAVATAVGAIVSVARMFAEMMRETLAYNIIAMPDFVTVFGGNAHLELYN